MAALLHDPALKDEPELLAAVGAAAGIALENGRLQAEQQAQLEELKGSRARVIEAGQQERQRLERNLHDGAQQRLIALSLELSLLEKQAGRTTRRRRRGSSGARREIAVSLDELRAVARGLHPAVLSGHGLDGGAPVDRRAGADSRCGYRRARRRASPSRSRWPPTTSSRRASPTSASTRARRR